MKINRISDNKLNISLNAEDLHKVGITFDTFKNDKETAESFLINFLAVIDELGIFPSSGKKVIVDVIITKSGIMSIYFETESFPKKRCKNVTQACCCFSEHKKLIEFAKFVYENYNNKIRSAELYLLNGEYLLILSLDYAKSTILSKPQLKNSILDEIFINKIREYGQLLTRNPLEKIIIL